MKLSYDIDAVSVGLGRKNFIIWTRRIDYMKSK
jgi:hypothetical protein